MTTIAFDGKQLAADSQSSFGGDVYYKEQGEEKKYHKVNGYIVCTAGDAHDQVRLRQWAKTDFDDKKVPKFTSGNERIVFKKNGKPYVVADDGVMDTIHVPFAIGSGKCEAMGAMLAGANAKKAVQIAAKLDRGTGGSVRTMTVSKRK